MSKGRPDQCVAWRVRARAAPWNMLIRFSWHGLRSMARPTCSSRGCVPQSHSVLMRDRMGNNASPSSHLRGSTARGIAAVQRGCAKPSAPTGQGNWL